MKRTIIFLGLCTATAFPLLASAATTTAQLSIHGAIKPATCQIAMQGGNTFDAGIIPMDTLSKTTPTRKGTANHPTLQINCTASTLFALKATDQRAGTAITPDTPAWAPEAFGLGLFDGIKLGAYLIGIDLHSLKGDGAEIYSYAVSAPGEPMNADNVRYGIKPTGYLVFSKSSYKNAPSMDPFKTLSMTFSITPQIAASSTLPQGKNIPLDGLATIELVYL